MLASRQRAVVSLVAALVNVLIDKGIIKPQRLLYRQ
jgi:hypothetical protein